MSQDNLREMVETIIRGLERIPNPPRDRIKKEFDKIKNLIIDNRPPKILIFGRRGAGKSSIINAIFNEQVAKVGPVVSETGKAKWHKFRNNKGAIEILDTRGIGDRTKPESANFATAIDDIKDAIDKVCPDAILFLCKAKEVDAHISQDIANVKKIQIFISEIYSYDIPTLALTTQVDELDPPRIQEPPYENDIKQNNIQKAVDTMKAVFIEAQLSLLQVIPVSAYSEYENGKKTYDAYWNIDILIEYLMEVLPTSAQLQLARLSSLKKTQYKFARMLVNTTAPMCAGIASIPIPMADIAPITGLQITMILGIAYLAGKELSKKTAREFLVALGCNIGAAFVFKEVARALVKFVFPGIGNLVSAGVAYVGTLAIGESAIVYFIDDASIEEAKLKMKRVKDKHEEDEHKDYKTLAIL